MRVQALLTKNLDTTDCGELVAGTSLLDAELISGPPAVKELSMLNTWERLSLRGQERPLLIPEHHGGKFAAKVFPSPDCRGSLRQGNVLLEARFRRLSSRSLALSIC